MFSIEYSNQSKKILKDLDKIITKRILNKIEKLSYDKITLVISNINKRSIVYK